MELKITGWEKNPTEVCGGGESYWNNVSVNGEHAMRCLNSGARRVLTPTTPIKLRTETCPPRSKLLLLGH